ncbi:MAG: hypothetical protein JOY65_13030 [Acetobacteraceae bacterium]|nr:hypothetical protein [Acetobacteraceae bacterium]
MSFQSFLQNPKGYLKVHEMQLNGGGANLVPASVTRAPPIANAAHGTSIQFTHIANVQMTQMIGNVSVEPKNPVALALREAGLIRKRRMTYTPAVGGPFPNLRILPWSETDITFMQLNGAADFTLTGPLTGCTVAVARHAGAVWLFHANVAGGGGVGPGNLVIKRQMVQNAGAIVGIPPGAYTYCEMTAQYTGLGFVWGRQRAGGNWKFYVHDINPGAGGNTTNDTKWATV